MIVLTERILFRNDSQCQRGTLMQPLRRNGGRNGQALWGLHSGPSAIEQGLTVGSQLSISGQVRRLMLLLFRYLFPHPHRMAGLLLRTKSRSLTDPRIQFCSKQSSREKRKERKDRRNALALLAPREARWSIPALKSDRVQGGCHPVIGFRPPSPVVPGRGSWGCVGGLLTPR